MRNLRGMSKLCFSSCEVNKKATARSIRLPNCHENTSEVALIPSVSFRRPSLLPLLIKPDK